MHGAVREFAERALTSADVRDKDVLETGSLDVNGSMTLWVNLLMPKSYIKTDMRAGKNVDLVLDACDVCAHFGAESFDLVLSTEMLEHVRDWVQAVDSMKDATRPGGVIILTARAPGATLHDYPGDYWRFSEDAMTSIFQDWTIELLESDPTASGGRVSNSGTFVKARKPVGAYTRVRLEEAWAMPMPVHG